MPGAHRGGSGLARVEEAFGEGLTEGFGPERGWAGL